MIFEIFPVRHVAGKLADVAIRFEDGEPLFGFTLHGFQVWAPRDGNPQPGVTVPARDRVMGNGNTVTVVLLKDGRTDTYTDAPASIQLKSAVLAAYDAHMRQGARKPRSCGPPSAPPPRRSPRLRPPSGRCGPV
jgi:hypothetical protein